MHRGVIAMEDFASTTAPWWLTTRACEFPSAAGTAGFLDWAAFLFLSTCSQRAMLSAASSAFLLVVFCLAAYKVLSRRREARAHGALNGNGNGAHKPLLDRGDSPRVQVGAGFVLAIAASALLAVFYGVLFVLSVVARGGGEVQEAVFLALQSAAHLAAAALVAHEKRFRAAAHPLTLRLFWLHPRSKP